MKIIIIISIGLVIVIIAVLILPWLLWVFDQGTPEQRYVAKIEDQTIVNPEQSDFYDKRNGRGEVIYAVDSRPTYDYRRQLTSSIDFIVFWNTSKNDNQSKGPYWLTFKTLGYGRADQMTISDVTITSSVGTSYEVEAFEHWTPSYSNVFFERSIQLNDGSPMRTRAATDSFEQFLSAKKPLDFNFANGEEITLKLTVTYSTASGDLVSEDMVIHFVPTITYFKGPFL